MMANTPKEQSYSTLLFFYDNKRIFVLHTHTIIMVWYDVYKILFYLNSLNNNERLSAHDGSESSAHTKNVLKPLRFRN